MKSSEFAGKFKSRYLWGNLAAMAAVVVLLCTGIKYGLDLYTHHGESIPIPNIVHRSYADAERILDDAGLQIQVTDTGYVKSLPPDCILAQSPDAGERVKAGRIVYVTINSPHTPTLVLPDIIDNSSLREAMAKLTAMGFKLGQPQYINGEKDWVYGILVRGRHVATGDRISVEDQVIIQVGNGLRDASDSVNYVDPVYPESHDDQSDMMEDFEEVTAPPSEPAPQVAQPPSVKPAAPVKEKKTE